MERHEERDLLARAKKDPEAFGQIYEQNYSRIFNYILKRVMNFEIAQDITSEVFFKAFQNIWKFQWMQISISSWFFRIATHEIVNYFRKNKFKTVSLEHILDQNSFEPSNGENPYLELRESQEILEQHQEFLRVHAKILQLPLKYQTVLMLKFFEKKKIKEIAQIIQKKEGTVKSLLSRGMEKLRILMQTEPSTYPEVQPS